MRPTRIVLVLCAVACAVSAWLAPSVTAQAAPGEWPGSAQATGSNYRGWAYVHGGRSVPVWRWTSNGTWEPRTAQPALPAWVEPWTADWSWAWLDGAWHAVSPTWLRVWSCTAPVGATTRRLHAAAAGTELHATGSLRLSSLPAGTRVELVCTNAFADANPGAACSTTGCATRWYALVRARRCILLTVPGSTACDGSSQAMYVPTSAIASVTGGGGGTIAVSRRVRVRAVRARVTRQGVSSGSVTVFGTSSTMRLRVRVLLGGREALDDSMTLANTAQGSTHTIPYYGYSTANLPRGTRVRVIATVRGGGRLHRRVRSYVIR